MSKLVKSKFFLAPLILVLGLAWFRPVTAPLTFSNDNLPKPPPTTTLLAVGDIMLSRNIGTKIEAARNPELPFEKIIPLVSEADIAFGNLECPLSDSAIRIREGLVFRCLIDDSAGLKSAGFDVLGTTNNHSFDQGRDALGFTAAYLKNVWGILAAGTGQNFDEAHTAQVISPHLSSPTSGEELKEGVKFGFLAYSYSARNDGGKTADEQIATITDLRQLNIDVLNAKAQADVIIVSMHAGIEYVRDPNQEQTDFAHAAIDAGADIVIGHHPHWIQTIEIYSPSPSPDEGRAGEGSKSGKPIFYSLGNFIFDQSWSVDTTEGLAVRFTFRGKELRQAELLPVIIENNCCPRLATETETQNILKKINATSSIISFE